MSTYRDRLTEYVWKKYRAKPEFLWLRYPGYAVFRHGDNQKWFALLMDLPRQKLGLRGEGSVDVLNVKLGDARLVELLTQEEGIFPGYHISRGNWISLLLDGTVAFEDVCHWLGESFLTTASAQTRQKLRPPKDWLVPANPKYYDVERAFALSEEIDWKQGAGIKMGDTVYLYVASPVSAIRYRCRVTETDIPCRVHEGRVRISSLMRLRRLKEYAPDRFPFERLGREYGIRAVRGPRGIPEELSEELREG